MPTCCRCTAVASFQFAGFWFCAAHWEVGWVDALGRHVLREPSS